MNSANVMAASSIVTCPHLTALRMALSLVVFVIWNRDPGAGRRISCITVWRCARENMRRNRVEMIPVGESVTVLAAIDATPATNAGIDRRDIDTRALAIGVVGAAVDVTKATRAGRVHLGDTGSHEEDVNDVLGRVHLGDEGCNADHEHKHVERAMGRNDPRSGACFRPPPRALPRTVHTAAVH